MEDRYFKVRLTTPRLAARGKVLVYHTVLDEGQQRDCAQVSREHGYGESEMVTVSAIKNVTSNLPHGEGDEELIPVSVQEISIAELGSLACKLMRRKN